ncbi:HAD-like protein [Nemania abortiva]|nr:HAD-like protein [Nemania abortiva]
MPSKIRGLVFDLGGVLLEWDRHSATGSLSSEQFLTIMNTTTWHSLDRGTLDLKAACKYFGELLGAHPNTIETALEQAQLSLSVNVSLVRTIYDLRESNPDLKFYVMSNISREHFEMVQKLDIPWSMFASVFASGVEGMRKPDLCFFQHVINQAGLLPNELLMIDDTAENICAARSLGMHGLLVDNKLAKSGGALRNLLQDPSLRAEQFMKANAGNHHCIVEGRCDIVLKDNFAQLLIWDVTGEADLIYLKYPSGDLLQAPVHASMKPNGTVLNRLDIKNGLWNYFYETPVLTTAEFPPDADTTSIAYLSLPEEYLDRVSDVKVVLNAMAENLEPDGIMRTYFSKDRPRTTPEVCCNILRLFHRFGYDSDPRINKTEEWVVKCLNNKACLNGNRHYSTPETFLYFVARLYVGCSERLRKELGAIHSELMERIDVPTNPLALALRISACQLVGINHQRYKKDLELLMSLQDEDGGWPAGHFCCIGRTGARIGNRGLTTALAMKIIRDDQLKA